jgi:hypothetical protein
MYRHMTLEALGAGQVFGGDGAGGSSGAPGLLRGFDRAQSHTMTLEEIDHWVRRGVPGRFALGYRDARGAFRIQYVGYAPVDLNAELKGRLGKSKYFKFRVGPLPAAGNRRGPHPPSGP